MYLLCNWTGMDFDYYCVCALLLGCVFRFTGVFVRCLYASISLQRTVYFITTCVLMIEKDYLDDTCQVIIQQCMFIVKNWPINIYSLQYMTVMTILLEVNCAKIFKEPETILDSLMCIDLHVNHSVILKINATLRISKYVPVDSYSM